LSLKSSSSLPPAPIMRITWTKDLTQDDLTLYFENKRKSGGGDIKNFDLNLEMKEGTIEFENPLSEIHSFITMLKMLYI